MKLRTVGKKEKSEYTMFSNRALAALIFPLVVEQVLAITVGMVDTMMISYAGEAAISVYRQKKERAGMQRGGSVDYDYGIDFPWPYTADAVWQKAASGGAVWLH